MSRVRIPTGCNQTIQLTPSSKPGLVLLAIYDDGAATAETIYLTADAARQLARALVAVADRGEAERLLDNARRLDQELGMGDDDPVD
jgi:hypothetical protein